MNFKLIAIYVLSAALFFSCKPTEHEEALSLLEQSKEMVSQNNEQGALLLLDSIHSRYSRDISARRMADTIRWNIEYRQSVRTLPQVDSMLVILNDTLPFLTKQFKYIKNQDYQDKGTFEHRQLRTENNTGRCYLKPVTDEDGTFSITSYYLGANTKHTQMEVTVDSVTVTSLPAPESCISRFVDVDMYREIIIFDQETLNGADKFIAGNSHKRMKVKLTGNNQPYIYYLNQTEKDIISQTYQLSVALSDLKRLTDQQLRLTQKIELLKRRLNL